MAHEKHKPLCREAWEDGYNHLRNDKAKGRDEGKSCIRNESIETYLEYTTETDPFQR